MSRKVKIGLALGGGGAKGAAHVGVLNVFEKYGIEISSIVGTSSGSIIGAAYALGIPPDEILKRSAKFYSKKFFRFSNLRLFTESLVSDRDVNNAIYSLVGDKTFEDTKIPFAAVAIDLESGKEVLLNEGALKDAVRASSALPGIYTPTFVDKRYLVDGGLLNNVPADYLRGSGGPDIVVAVDLGSLVSRQYVSGLIWQRYYQQPETFKLHPGYLTKLKLNLSLMLHVLLRSIDIAREESQVAHFKRAKPSIVIKPHLESISFLQFNKNDEAVKAGEKAAEEMMPQLLKLIKEKSASKKK